MSKWYCESDVIWYWYFCFQLFWHVNVGAYFWHCHLKNTCTTAVYMTNTVKDHLMTCLGSVSCPFSDIILVILVVLSPKVFWMTLLYCGKCFDIWSNSNSSVASVRIWDGSVWSLPLWESGSYELGEHRNMCISLKDQRGDMWLLPHSIPRACSPFSPSPLSPFMCSLFLKQLFSPPCLPV